jgi:hypothetical protein
VHADLREITPAMAGDRYWASEMAALQGAVLAGAIAPANFLGGSQ